jgi:hypothetical protein
MCPDVSDEWRADPKRRRRIPIFGPVAWYGAALMSAASVLLVIAAFLVVLFSSRGSQGWLVVAIVLAAVGFVIAVPAVLAWLSRKTWDPGKNSTRSGLTEPATAGAWSDTLVPQHDLPEGVEGGAPCQAPPDEHRRRARFQWLMVLAFIMVVVIMMFIFRSFWSPQLVMP